MNTMKEANDQQKEMALKKKIYLLPVPALLLCLYLAACSSLVDTGSSGSALPDGMEPVTDMAFLDGTWSIAGTTKLYFDSTRTAIISTADAMALAAAGSFQKWTADP